MSRPELRWDVLEAAWRIIPAGRQGRPNLPDRDCPFCPGGLEAPEPYRVRVFPNRWPSMVPGPLEAGVARGAAEVILYSSEHDGTLGDLPDDHLADVVDAWRKRTVELSQRPEVASVLCFENRGPEVGATISHPHGQIYGFPFVPPRVAAILQGPGCRVCDDMAAATLVLAEDDHSRCWLPDASAWPYAFRLAPRRHAGSLAEISADEEASWRATLGAALRAFDALWDLPMPYMLDLHQTGVHMWLEVVSPLRAPGVLRYVAAGEIGSGTYQNPVRPEDAYASLREVWR